MSAPRGPGRLGTKVTAPSPGRQGRFTTPFRPQPVNALIQTTPHWLKVTPSHRRLVPEISPKRSGILNDNLKNCGNINLALVRLLTELSITKTCQIFDNAGNLAALACNYV